VELRYEERQRVHAREVGFASPLIDVCYALYDEALNLGLGGADMVAVLRAIEARTERQR
jgi:3-hydroxyisobutyrate dehydrogenase